MGRHRLRGLPPPSGRYRHDLLLGLTDVALTAMWTASGMIRRPALPEPRAARWPLTVVDRRMVARDENVVALTLAAPDRAALPPWHPGSHLDIHLPSGRIRQYSLCGEPGLRSAYRIAVRRIPDGGGGSIEVHDGLDVGATVSTGGPRNAFPFTVPGYGSPARRVRFVAGGIGITPILPMLAPGGRLGVDWSMVYTGRSLDSIPFLDEVRRFGDRVRIRTDDVDGVPDADELLGVPGCHHRLRVRARADADAAAPPRLAGRDDVELHFERFAAAPVVDRGRIHRHAAGSGRNVTVAPDDFCWPPCSARRRGPVLVPAGILRHLPRPCPGRCCAASGYVAHRTRAGRRDDSDLRVARRRGEHLVLDL